MGMQVDAYGIPYDDPNQHSRRTLAHAMMGRPNNGNAGTLPTIPAAPAQPGIGMGAGMRDTLGSAAGGAMLGGAAGGPIGALAGAMIAGGIQRARLGTPSQAAQAAMAGGWDGFSQGGPIARAAPAGGSYAVPTDPHQAALLRGQRAIDAERQHLAGSQPQTIGQGIEAIGTAFNLAMKQRAQAQAAADPWAGMRESSGAAGGGLDIGSAFKKLFG